MDATELWLRTGETAGQFFGLCTLIVRSRDSNVSTTLTNVKFKPYQRGDLVWIDDPTMQRQKLEPNWTELPHLMRRVLYTTSWI